MRMGPDTVLLAARIDLADGFDSDRADAARRRAVIERRSGAT